MYSAKYSASGNDFIIFHSFVKRDRSALARALCHRHLGVGADGLIVLCPSDEAAFEWEFYNSDGSVASMCGNGARAAALYAYEQGLAPAQHTFITGAGRIAAEVSGELVEIELSSATILRQGIEALGHRWWLIDTGVPHLVGFEESGQILSTQELASLRHKYNANVNIARQTPEGIALRTFERGVEGETLACGTGMAATFLRAHQEGLVGVRATLIPASLERLWLRLEGSKIFFKGRVNKVCDTILPFSDQESKECV